MPATRFKGPVRTGQDTGAPSTTTLSTLPAIRKISVSADGVYSAGGIPACDIVRVWINTFTAWEGSAGCTTTIRVGTSADNDLYGSVVLSAVGTRDLNLSAAAIGLASGVTMIVDVTTVGTAGVGLGAFFVEYLQAE